jgi:hypothetical protein
MFAPQPNCNQTLSSNNNIIFIIWACPTNVAEVDGPESYCLVLEVGSVMKRK